jgi:hypothetical protein
MRPARCIELQKAHVESGVRTREDCLALLEHLAYVAEPGTGAPMMLLVFARMATTACVWLDGDLRVELRRDRETVWVDVLTELGTSMRERVFPSLAVNAPLEEFLGAVKRVPQMIKPLTALKATADLLSLGATAYIRRTSKPAPMIEISDVSLFDPHGVRK